MSENERKAIACKLVAANEEYQNARYEADCAKRKMEAKSDELDRLKVKLRECVGANIPERLFVVGNKAVVVKWANDGSSVKVYDAECADK